MEQKFFAAVQDGKVEDVKEMLRTNPTLNVNWANEDGDTALTKSCDRGDGAIVSILLAHPDIDVNLQDKNGWTPFSGACIFASPVCVRLLLKDPRVRVNKRDNWGSTPLKYVAANGHCDIVKWWIASGRDVDLGEPGIPWTDAIGQAKKVMPWQDEVRRARMAEVAALLERFQEDPGGTRLAVRLEVGWYEAEAVEMFALVVFVSDGLLQAVSQGEQDITPAARFFNIATQLPLELQMVLCYRAGGSTKEIIPGRESEAAFKDLARRI